MLIIEEVYRSPRPYRSLSAQPPAGRVYSVRSRHQASENIVF